MTDTAFIEKFFATFAVVADNPSIVKKIFELLRAATKFAQRFGFDSSSTSTVDSSGTSTVDSSGTSTVDSSGTSTVDSSGAAKV